MAEHPILLIRWREIENHEICYGIRVGECNFNAINLCHSQKDEYTHLMAKLECIQTTNKSK